LAGASERLILLNFEVSHKLTTGECFVATQAIAHHARSTGIALNATRGSGLDALLLLGFLILVLA
jgi:hypothetical protein